MKKLILLLFSFLILFVPILLFAGSLQQKHKSVITRKNVSASGTCDTVVWSVTGTPIGDIDIKRNTTNVFGGQILEDTSSYTVCKVSYNMTYKAGDISTKIFRAFIYTLDGTDNLVTGTEADGTVTGSNAWSQTDITFEWDSGYVLTANISYAIVITMDGAIDGSNYAELERAADTVIPGGTASWWESDGTLNTAGSGDVKLIIYSE